MIAVAFSVYRFIAKKRITTRKTPEFTSPIEETQRLLETLQACNVLTSSDVSKVLVLFDPIAIDSNNEQNEKVVHVTTRYLSALSCDILSARQDLLTKELALRETAQSIVDFLQKTKFRPTSKPESFHSKRRAFAREIELLLQNPDSIVIESLVSSMTSCITFLEGTHGKYCDSHCCNFKNWTSLRTIQLRLENCSIAFANSQDLLEISLNKKKSATAIFNRYGIV